jgi:hypothetical protein
MMPVLMMKVMEPFRVTHRLETGTKRYVDAVNREGRFLTYP